MKRWCCFSCCYILYSCWRFTIKRSGSSARIERQVCAADRDGLLGAKRSNSRSYCEHLQRGRPPETADAHGATICAEGP
ncbi:MAG: hypothetical protein EOO29_49290 [Comamonadaceae bacterium]|nr:MAG: hypothetical protein EOO29_49290 [Comamonadaceae bacterium]